MSYFDRLSICVGDESSYSGYLGGHRSCHNHSWLLFCRIGSLNLRLTSLAGELSLQFF